MEAALHGQHRDTLETSVNQLAVVRLDRGDGKMRNVVVGNRAFDLDLFCKSTETGPENDTDTRSGR